MNGFEDFEDLDGLGMSGLGAMGNVEGQGEVDALGELDILSGMNGIGGTSGAMGDSSTGGMPVGFGMSLAMNEIAMKGFSAMTEDEKERIILRARDAKSKKEMNRIVDSLAESDDEEVRKLRQEAQDRIR